MNKKHSWYNPAFAFLFLCLDVHAASNAFDLKAKPDVEKEWTTSKLQEEGYIEIKNPYVTKSFYRDLYNTFDEMIAQANQDPSFRKALMTLEDSFRASSYQHVFCGAPAGYRDRGEKVEKDKKQYFQFSAEYYTLVKEKHPNLLEQYPLLKDFFDKLAFVDYASKLMFKRIIHRFSKGYSTLASLMYGQRSDLTVLIKVLAYDGAPHQDSGTSPHYDKSGLTLILDNDDRRKESLVLCPYEEPFQVCKLKAPKRGYAGAEAHSSALLIAGSLLQIRGVNIKPTPHAVLSFYKKKRHSIIAFALIPCMDVSKIKSMIIDKKNIPNFGKKGESRSGEGFLK